MTYMSQPWNYRQLQAKPHHGVCVACSSDTPSQLVYPVPSLYTLSHGAYGGYNESLCLSHYLYYLHEYIARLIDTIQIQASQQLNSPLYHDVRHLEGRLATLEGKSARFITFLDSDDDNAPL